MGRIANPDDALARSTHSDLALFLHRLDLIPEYVDEFEPATGPYRDQVIARMGQRADEITYWKSIYADLQASGVASTHSRDTISPGDLVQRRGHWYPVVRVNPKTVSVRMHEGATWTNTIGYHEISGHRAAEDHDPNGAGG